MTPLQDYQRVTGQIERGEVLAGPEAARIIAARHEAAYGDVWKRKAEREQAEQATAAWEDAVRGLLTGVTEEDTA